MLAINAYGDGADELIEDFVLRWIVWLTDIRSPVKTREPCLTSRSL
jgi:hypothetical protein